MRQIWKPVGLFRFLFSEGEWEGVNSVKFDKKFRAPISLCVAQNLPQNGPTFIDMDE